MLSFLASHKILSTVFGVAIVMVAALVFSRLKKVAPVSWGWFSQVNQTDGVALDGYDPVSYHEGAAPARGRADVTWSWQGAEWRFVDQENLARFRADPARFAPQFGGYCAFAVSKGFTAAADPLAWHIEDDQLYVFDGESVKTKWIAQLGENVVERTRRSWARRPE